MLVIIDIDGSIADFKPRNKAAGLDPGRVDVSSYKKYISNLMRPEEMIKDTPVLGMQQVLRAICSADLEIIYLTGRSEINRHVTERWLLDHRFPAATLMMRGPDDWRSSVDYKKESVEKLLDTYKTIVAIEDEPDVAAMMMELGITVLQVHYKEVE